MAVTDRSFPEILQSIVGDIGEIVRSEVRLAKSEVREESIRLKPAALLSGTAVAAALFAVFFMLIAAVAGLSLVMPMWAASLIVSGVLAIVAASIYSSGIKRWRVLYPAVIPRNEKI